MNIWCVESTNKSIEMQIRSPSIYHYHVSCFLPVETTNESKSKQSDDIERPWIFYATDKNCSICLPMFVSSCFPLCIKGTNSIPKYLARVLMQSMNWGCTLSLIKNWFLASRFNKIKKKTNLQSSDSTIQVVSVISFFNGKLMITPCLTPPPTLEFTARAIIAIASAAAVPSSNKLALATSMPVSSQTNVW